MLRLIWAARFWGCLRNCSIVMRLGVEVLQLLHRTFVEWHVWASRLWNCLTRLFVVTRLGYEVLGPSYEVVVS